MVCSRVIHYGNRIAYAFGDIHCEDEFGGIGLLDLEKFRGNLSLHPKSLEILGGKVDLHLRRNRHSRQFYTELKSSVYLSKART